MGGLMKARTVSPIGNIMFALLGGIIGGGATPGAASPHSGRLGGLWEVWRDLREGIGTLPNPSMKNALG